MLILIIAVGVMVVPAAVAGELAGGAIIKKWDLKLKQILKMSIICSILSLALVPVYLAHCSNSNLAGVMTGYARYYYLSL